MTLDLEYFSLNDANLLVLQLFIHCVSNCDRIKFSTLKMKSRITFNYLLFSKRLNLSKNTYEFSL